MKLREAIDAAVEEYFEAGGEASGRMIAPDLLRNILYKHVVLGATGQQPNAKMAPDDQGQIRLAIGVDKNNNLIIDFGTPVKWVGLTMSEAREFVATLQEHIS